MPGIYNYGGSPFSPTQNRTYSDIPEDMKSFYNEQPNYVFANWLNEQGISDTQRSAIGSGLYEDLYSDWYRDMHIDGVNTPHFGDYLQSLTKSGGSNALQNKIASYSMRARGADPRQFTGRTRWMGF